MAIQIKLRMAKVRTPDQRLADQLEAIGVDAEQAVDELRTLAHGIYPPALRTSGLADALRAFARKRRSRSPWPTTVSAAVRARSRRRPTCAMEAVQNAIKHAGDGARSRSRSAGTSRRIHFAVADDGRGMASAASRDGEAWSACATASAPWRRARDRLLAGHRRRRSAGASRWSAATGRVREVEG